MKIFLRDGLRWVGSVVLLTSSVHCGSKPDKALGSVGEGGSGAGSGGAGVGIAGADGTMWTDYPVLQGDGGSTGQGGRTSTDPELGGCGDAIVDSGEACDDGNDDAGDGCSATCAELEQDFACPTPGASCVYTVACGDGRLSGAEQCDDGNELGADGCSVDCQNLAAGWSCVTPGLRCEATSCGDGIVAGFEECDFGDVPTTGCSDCRIDDGYDCDDFGCAATACGNGEVERGEQCEDANTRPFDGCFNCKREPACTDGVCTSVCGDGQRFADEPCDDGNTRNGDGCSSTCQIETGYACTLQAGTPPTTLALPVVFRDFIGEGNSLRALASCYNPVNDVPSPAKPIPCFHIDFNGLGGSGIRNVVEADLGSNGRPVYRCPGGDCNQNPGHLFVSGSRPNFNGPVPFAEWYSTSANSIEVVKNLTLTYAPAQGTYVFDASNTFYPIDADGWVAAGAESLASAGCQHNVSFSSETHFWFEYQGGEQFTFSGDDDLWVFVNGKLVLDLGGLHVSQTATFVLDADSDGALTADTADGTADVSGHYTNPNLDLGLSVGGVYDISLFHAERNECGSNFKVTLKDFNKPKSVCASTCGDGVVASDELCDDGLSGNDGAYGHCGSDCRSRGPYCGDHLLQTGAGELCDDGQNLTGYGQGCAPGCRAAARCGDGQIDGVFGETCDDGVNDGGHNGCTPDCQSAERCGDGVRQNDEECDDGNLLGGDGCTRACALERPR